MMRLFRIFEPASTGTVVGAAVVCSLLVACSDPAGPEGDPGPLIDSLPRALTSSEEFLIDGSNGFGIDLIREVLEVDQRPNVVLSPLSAAVALGMTLNGAAGATQDGMREALRFGALSRPEINDSFQGLLGLLGDLDPEVELSVANSTWANEDYSFLPTFFTEVTEHFDATAESRDFADPGTLSDINTWVEQNTNGKIDKILEEGELDPALALLILNAVYFDGRWTTEFDPDETRESQFTRSDGSTVTVDMMNMSSVEFPMGGSSELTAVELPYGGGVFSMVVAVPRTWSPARDILEGMSGSDWEALIASLAPVELEALSIPRFQLAYDTFLNDPLADMGMGLAFTSQADFSDLSPVPLCIDFVRQKTFIEVDEAGTRAAAVTGVGIGPTSFIALIADRPFIFAIRERLTGTILFIGLIGDPTEEDSGPAEFPAPCRAR